MIINHPIRKRAWHRAYKRKALWAICAPNHIEKIQAMDQFAEIHSNSYCPGDKFYVTWPNIGWTKQCIYNYGKFDS